MAQGTVGPSRPVALGPWVPLSLLLLCGSCSSTAYSPARQPVAPSNRAPDDSDGVAPPKYTPYLDGPYALGYWPKEGDRLEYSMKVSSDTSLTDGKTTHRDDAIEAAVDYTRVTQGNKRIIRSVHINKQICHLGTHVEEEWTGKNVKMTNEAGTESMVGAEDIHQESRERMLGYLSAYYSLVPDMKIAN